MKGAFGSLLAGEGDSWSQRIYLIFREVFLKLIQITLNESVMSNMLTYVKNVSQGLCSSSLVSPVIEAVVVTSIPPTASITGLKRTTA